MTLTDIVEQKKPSKKGANCISHLFEDPDQGKNQSMVTREQNNDEPGQRKGQGDRKTEGR